MPIFFYPAALTAALIHILFFCVESLWWGKPPINAAFKLTPADAEVIRLIAFNQGFYNLFLALGVVGGWWSQNTAVVAFCCACMVGAGIVLWLSGPHLWRGALIQAIPPLLALIGWCNALRN